LFRIKVLAEFAVGILEGFDDSAMRFLVERPHFLHSLANDGFDFGELFGGQIQLLREPLAFAPDVILWLGGWTVEFGARLSLGIPDGATGYGTEKEDSGEVQECCFPVERHYRRASSNVASVMANSSVSS